MKKLLGALLLVTMLLGLVACGEDSTAQNENQEVPVVEEVTQVNEEEVSIEEDAPSIPTKEELLEIATELSAYNLVSEYRENPTKAAMAYAGQTYLFYGSIVRINADSVDLEGPSSYLRLALSAEEIVTLESGQWISAVGTLMDMDEANIAEWNITLTCAYLVSDAVETTCTVSRMWDTINDDGAKMMEVEYDYAILESGIVYGSSTTAYPDDALLYMDAAMADQVAIGDEIVVSAKAVYSGQRWVLQDAILLSGGTAGIE